MYTSDKKTCRDGYLSVIGVYLSATVLCALFGAVYERFSHGVYSYFMLYAFAAPLLLGLAPFFLLMKSRRRFPHRLFTDFVHAGVAALTAASLLRGVLDIYGTASPLLIPLWITGAAFTAAGWLLSLWKTA